MTTQPPSPPARVTDAKVYVRGLLVHAQIGVYDYEHGRTQPLVIEVELDVKPGPFESLADIFNYEMVGARAQEILATGHIKLVETFAEALARAILRDHRVLAACVRVDKPEALPPAVAGVSIRVVRE